MSKLLKRLMSIEGLALISIIFLGAYLRLYMIREYMTFLGDEGRDVLIVRRIFTEFDIPFIGPTASVGGFFLGPIYYYFMAPFLFLFGMDPVGPAVMVALFGIATIYLLYKVGKEFYNTQTGIIAALTYSVSPLVIAHSRSSWNPNIVPFFSLLYVYSLWKAVATKDNRWYFVVGSCVGIGIQLHYLFLFLIPVGLVYLLLYARARKYIKHWLFIAFGALFFLIPFLGFEVKNNLPNTRTVINYIFSSDEVSYGSSNAFMIMHDVIYRLFGRLLYNLPPIEQIVNKAPWALFVWQTVIYGSIIISIGFLIYQLKRSKKNTNVLMLLWLVFGVGLFSFYQRQIYDYYFVIMFALPFLLVSSVLGTLWQQRHVKLVVPVLVAALFIFNWNARPFIYPPNNQVKQVEEIARRAFDMTEGKPFNFALVTDGNSDHAYRYFFEVWGNKPITIENDMIDPDRTSVTDQLIVICERFCEPVGHPLWEIAGFGQAEIADRAEPSFVYIYKLVHYESNSTTDKGEMIQ